MAYPPTSPVQKIDSNVTQSAYCVESSTAIGVLNAKSTQAWNVMEPNSYKDIGGKIKTVARQPINPSRQIRKGVLVDLDSNVNFTSDLTQTNMQDLLQGFFYANFNRKQEYGNAIIAGLKPVSGIASTAAGNTVVLVGSTNALSTGDLVFANGFTNLSNNGLLTVSTVTNNTFTVNQTLVVESSTSTQTITQVGFQFNTGDAQIVSTGGFPGLSTTTKNMSVWGLTVGEFIHIGGDASTTQFATSTDLGFCRVYTSANNLVQFDKTFFNMVADNGSTKTIQVFFGRVLYNQQPNSIIRRTYTWENILGNNDASNPTLQQAQYIPGSVANKFTFTLKDADKITVDLEYMGKAAYTLDESSTGANTLLSHAAQVGGGLVVQPSLGQAAFNTATDFPRIKLATFVEGTPCPLPLFAYATDMTVEVNNNNFADKALGVLGPFDFTAGFFQLTGKTTTYFTQVESIQAVLANANITLDFHIVQNNSGISMDLPMITLGGGLPKIEINKPVTMDFDLAFASGNYVNPNLDHTALMVFWDYLPTLAATI